LNSSFFSIFDRAAGHAVLVVLVPVVLLVHAVRYPLTLGCMQWIAGLIARMLPYPRTLGRIIVDARRLPRASSRPERGATDKRGALHGPTLNVAVCVPPVPNVKIE